MVTIACKGCGKKIAYARITKADGQPGVIPLDVSAPCYTMIMDETGQMVGTREHMAFVSHFATCAKANDFSKGTK